MISYLGTTIHCHQNNRQLRSNVQLMVVLKPYKIKLARIIHD